MSDALEDLREEIRELSRELGVLSKAFEVHIAAETEHRLRSMDKLDNVRLTFENTILKAVSDLRGIYDSKINDLSHRADKHIDECERENEQLEQGRKLRLNHIYGLWVSLILMALVMLRDFLSKH